VEPGGRSCLHGVSLIWCSGCEPGSSTAAERPHASCGLVLPAHCPAWRLLKYWLDQTLTGPLHVTFAWEVASCAWTRVLLWGASLHTVILWPGMVTYLPWPREQSYLWPPQEQHSHGRQPVLVQERGRALGTCGRFSAALCHHSIPMTAFGGCQMVGGGGAQAHMLKRDNSVVREWRTQRQVGS
jgi:hypothetical protein